MQNVEDLLYPNTRKDRPLIAYDIKDDVELSITPNTKFFRTKNTWVDAELYFYGILKDAGGKNKVNIHIDTEDYGYLAIESGQGFLMQQEENLLYKKFGVRAIGKQNLETGEIDTKTLKLVELIDYNPKFDSDYLSRLISKAKKNWKGINADEWHAKRTGEFATVIFEENKIDLEHLKPRAIIPNDSKLFAQADLDKTITHFVTSDSRSRKTYTALKKKVEPRFEIIDISKPYNETFGILF